jgi:hypothetical protein
MRQGVVAIVLFLAFLLSGCVHAQASACDRSDKKSDCTKERTVERRRAVPAVIPQAPVLPPAVVQRQPAPSPQSSTPAPVIPAPSTVTSCDAGGCWDGGGTRYNNAAGNVFMNGAGKTCHQIGATMQCF